MRVVRPPVAHRSVFRRVLRIGNELHAPAALERRVARGGRLCPGMSRVTAVKRPSSQSTAFPECGPRATRLPTPMRRSRSGSKARAARACWRVRKQPWTSPTTKSRPCSLLGNVLQCEIPVTVLAADSHMIGTYSSRIRMTQRSVSFDVYGSQGACCPYSGGYSGLVLGSGSLCMTIWSSRGFGPRSYSCTRMIFRFLPSFP